jgi:hypothetical protein
MISGTEDEEIDVHHNGIYTQGGQQDPAELDSRTDREALMTTRDILWQA